MSFTLWASSVEKYLVWHFPYYRFVHGRLPYDSLKPDHVLRSLLLSLPIRKVVSFSLLWEIQIDYSIYAWIKLSFWQCFWSLQHRFSPTRIMPILPKLLASLDWRTASIWLYPLRLWIRPPTRRIIMALITLIMFTSLFNPMLARSFRSLQSFANHLKMHMKKHSRKAASILKEQ